MRVPSELKQWVDEMLEANPGAKLTDIINNNDGSITFWLEKDGEFDSITLEPED